MADTPDPKWQEFLDCLRNQVSPQDFSTWFSVLKMIRFANGELFVGVPNRFFPEIIEQRFAGELKNALAQAYGPSARLHYQVVNPEAGGSSERERELQARENKQEVITPQTRRVLPLDPNLNPSYTFDNFLEGEANRLSRSVGLNISENPGRGSFNPFFLYGPSGVGKTHLANAIGVRTKQLHPEMRVLFVSAHVFKTQYTESVRKNTQNDFINFYQTIDVLIIDDIQEITTAKTQLAFFHIFNHLQQNNRQIVITCDRPPVLFEGIEERMLTRFKWGMVAEMERPDVKLRRDILRSKIKRDGLTFPENVISFIAKNVESSVRELEGIVNSIMAYSVVDNCDIDLALAERVVARAVNLEKKQLTADDIIQTVAQHFSLKAKDLISKSRKQAIVRARQLAIFLCHKYTDMPYLQIGQRFGGRDHSTIIYSCNQVTKDLSTVKDYRRTLEEIEAKLKR